MHSAWVKRPGYKRWFYLKAYSFKNKFPGGVAGRSNFLQFVMLMYCYTEWFQNNIYTFNLWYAVFLFGGPVIGWYVLWLGPIWGIMIDAAALSYKWCPNFQLRIKWSYIYVNGWQFLHNIFGSLLLPLPIMTKTHWYLENITFLDHDHHDIHFGRLS